MSDTPSTDGSADTSPDEQQQGDPAPQLGDGGKKALDAERRAKRAAEQRAASLETRLREFEDAGKTESQRLTEQLTSAVTRAEAAEKAVTRLTVALKKGVPFDHVHRLSGDTEDDLAADAESLLALVNPQADDSRLPGPRPDMTQGHGASTPLNGDPLLRDLKSKLGIP